MKLFYTICLILSSFFTYKQLSADTTTKWHAFFIPKNTFQQNTTVKQINIPEPQDPVIPSTTTDTPKKQSVTTTTTATQKTTTAKNTSNIRKKPTETSNLTQSKKNTTQAKAPKQSIPVSVEAAPSNTMVQEKLKKYQLDNPVTAQNNIKQDRNILQNIQIPEEQTQKTLKELLNTLPYPDFNLPKFKQLYGLYGLELRSLYRRGKFPPNPEQDATLAKANSLRRFEVK